MGKPKIPLKKVPADDCVVYVGRVHDKAGEIVVPGEPIQPHVGEWVELIPLQSVGQIMALSRCAALAAGAGESTTPKELLAMDGAFDDLCRGLAQRVVSWNWTDLMSEPLEQPYRRPDIIKALTSEEIMWLRQAVEGETPVERKNGSGPLPTTSSAGRARNRQR